MSDSHADIRHHVKIYIGVFVALAIATVLTVAASRVDFGGHLNMFVALGIAAIKASLVAAIFMHLKWERSMGIWLTLVFCFVFFGVLIWAPLSTAYDLPALTEHRTWDVSSASPHADHPEAEKHQGH